MNQPFSHTLPEKIGIIIGTGIAAKELLSHMALTPERVVVVTMREDEALKPWLAPFIHQRFSMDKIGAILEFFKNHRISTIVFSGKMHRPVWHQLRPDTMGKHLLKRIISQSLKGDNALIQTVNQFLEEEGFRILPLEALLPNSLVQEGPLGECKAHASHEEDIQLAIKAATAIGAIDAGQAAIVRDGTVIGLEALEGTASLLARAATIINADNTESQRCGVLAKVAKPGQDLRTDLPAIGPDTVTAVAKAGLAGIVLEASRTQIFSAAETIRLANQLGIFIEGRKLAHSSRTLCIIAAEPSGDTLGAELVAAMKQRTNLPFSLMGVGGPKLQAQGLQSLVPFESLGIMGFVEVIKHLPRLLLALRRVKKAILKAKPDIILTIDAPDFGCRIVESLPRSLSKRIHYVAPSVWAYRPERALKMARYYNHLLTLLPFEPPYFTAHGLAATMIGHPILEQSFDQGDAQAFRLKFGIEENALLLTVMCGSRKGEIARLWPIFSETIRRLHLSFPNLKIILPVLPSLAEKLQHLAASLPCATYVITDPIDRSNAYAASIAALSKSGTVTLELALAGLPMVVAHKIHPISAWLLKPKLKVKFVSIVNLLAEQALIPEYLQEQCEPKRLTEALGELLHSEAKRKQQIQAVKKALMLLKNPSGVPASSEAADIIARYW